MNLNKESEYNEPVPIDKLDLIIQLLHSIEDRITKIETHIAQIDETNTGVEKDCSKMRDHIQFIETTYDVIRTPLAYIKNNIDFIMGNDSQELPRINNTSKCDDRNILKYASQEYASQEYAIDNYATQELS